MLFPERATLRRLTSNCLAGSHALPPTLGQPVIAKSARMPSLPTVPGSRWQLRLAPLAKFSPYPRPGPNPGGPNPGRPGQLLLAAC